MASTRLKNAPCEYRNQQDTRLRAYKYVNSYDKLHNQNTAFPELGVNMGNIPGDMLSRNQADIESFLKGTYFNNLEEPIKNFTAEIKEVENVKFFNRPELLMPRDLQVGKNRPVIFRR